jgi:hypothetical protein
MTMADVLHVVQRMREQDRRCVHAMLGDIEDEAFAVNRWQTTGPAWAVCDEAGVPAVVGGLTLHNDWFAVAWLLAAPGLSPQTWRKVIRLGRTVLMNAANSRHAQYRHRIEAHVLAGWAEAERFAPRFGFRLEGVRRGAGSGGEDFQTWAIVGPVRTQP